MENISGKIINKEHRLPIRVYFSDTDAEGIVYHTNYLDMAEHGRTELFRSLAGSQQEALKDLGIGFVIRSLTIDYLKPAYLDDILEVRTRLSKSKAITILFEQEIFKEDTLICQLKVKAGSINIKSGKPTPFPKEWADKINQMICP